MAYSLSDIPERFLRGDSKLDFISWLSNMPIPDESKKSIITTWRKFTEVAFEEEDFTKAGLPAPGK